MITFYVYEHWRPDTNKCFYVGKGYGSRARDMKQRNIFHRRIQGKLEAAGLGVEIRIVYSDLAEKDAFALEIERIAFWRSSGNILANISDGGEGPRGRRHTEETKRLLAERQRGKKMSPEARLKISIASRNISQETRDRMGRARRGIPMSEAQRLRMIAIANNRGPEHFAKISAAKLGFRHSDETKRKISLRSRGRVRPPEERARISASMKALRARQREERTACQPV